MCTVSWENVDKQIVYHRYRPETQEHAPSCSRYGVEFEGSSGFSRNQNNRGSSGAYYFLRVNFDASSKYTNPKDECTGKASKPKRKCIVFI